jgi:hypothetical protein
VSFLFGGRQPRQDPEMAAAQRRQRAAFAADIGDEKGRAFAHELPIRRGRWTAILGLVLLVLAAVAVVPLLRGGPGGLVRADCVQPDIGASAGLIQPGSRASWQAAGPADTDYVVTLDAGAVRGTAAAVTPDTGRILAGPLRLTDCRSAQTLFDAPTGSGHHDLRLFHRTNSGWVAVASADLKVG